MHFHFSQTVFYSSRRDTSRAWNPHGPSGGGLGGRIFYWAVAWSTWGRNLWEWSAPQGTEFEFFLFNIFQPIDSWSDLGWRHVRSSSEHSQTPEGVWRWFFKGNQVTFFKKKSRDSHVVPHRSRGDEMRYFPRPTPFQKSSKMFHKNFSRFFDFPVT